ncbi:MAG: acyl-CoA synthetase [Actinomycetes bacterium]
MSDGLTVPENFQLANLWEAVVDRVGDRECLVCDDVRLSYAQLDERANRLANQLHSLGVGEGDFVGCYLTNGTPYIEAILACFKIRAVPVNINYRYVADELRYLLADAGVVVVVTEEQFADRLAEVASVVDPLRHALVVGGSAAGLAVLSGAGVTAEDYEEAIAASLAERPVRPERSNDDLYVLYTGGTTGMPKGVVWRHEDVFFGCLTGGDPMRLQGPVTTPGELMDRIIEFDFTFYALAPLMHAAAQWVSLLWFMCGARVVLHTGRFDPVEIWRTVEREQVSTLTVVGDAMARPLLDAWNEHGPFDTSSLFAFANGGAPMALTTRTGLQELMPNVAFTDGFGSSETGIQGSQRLEPGQAVGTAVRFDNVAAGTRVLDEGGQPVEPGSGVIGRVATSGRIPLRYHNAPEKTAEAFVEIDGVRYVVSGDMATVEADGSIVLLGRGSVSINTGGEKVFPEEVEGVLKTHPAVYDAVVVGVADDRWGQRVAAVVQAVDPESPPTLDDLREVCHEHLAGYKAPRQLVVVDTIERSPAGKADYRWAKSVAEAATADGSAD